MKSYVRNTINLSCAKILLTSVINGKTSSHRTDMSGLGTILQKCQTIRISGLSVARTKEIYCVGLCMHVCVCVCVYILKVNVTQEPAYFICKI